MPRSFDDYPLNGWAIEEPSFGGFNIRGNRLHVKLCNNRTCVYNIQMHMYIIIYNMYIYICIYICVCMCMYMYMYKGVCVCRCACAIYVYNIITTAETRVEQKC